MWYEDRRTLAAATMAWRGDLPREYPALAVFSQLARVALRQV